MEIEQYQQARLSRDPRFDGVFYIAVKTTGIFCRPICPATPPKEQNVEYFQTANEALVSGYRPCLRCRPESAPFSPAWNGTQTTVERALKIIHQEGFHDLNLVKLSERLGITDRYLRKLFMEKLGVSPKHYVQHQQILFAKSLLHQTHLSIQDIAFAAGFNNVRRFNDAFKKITTKTPSEIRKLPVSSQPIRLQLSYQPPYDWQRWHDFVEFRLIAGVEKLGNSSYSRTFQFNGADGTTITGWFNAVHRPDKQGFNVSIEISDSCYLYQVTQKVRQILDLNANAGVIYAGLLASGLPEHNVINGLRIPGCWSLFEAGVRAILGQQVSVKAATNLINTLTDELGERKKINGETHIWFPTAKRVAKSHLEFLKIPQSRKETLSRLAKYMITHPEKDPEAWLELKGIGPWTVEYAKMRGQGNTDIWLDTDLGVKKAMDIFPGLHAENAAPWRTYLTFNLWSML
ncbi:DNA-3-methyladenine glycosylase 2 family protein [Psychrosphaera ytuae]|uniref:DNA-3-methyladenine glycosylase 2 family protein n=1 Tax=Psychrosphaera ytuae TaxID=2820710 RepID=A0A975D9T4_9GAMM|nr:Ada metal-binding domain-containing protein [Psychrosphaera ytuae]QTH62988.1 DNA-3-methyladenine glycosylase 2 family protein [Psychrosphaera ytuae]